MTAFVQEMRIENKQFLVTNASQSRPPDSLLDPRPLYFLHPFEWRATVNNRALAQGTEPHLPDGILRRKISRSDDTTTAVSVNDRSQRSVEKQLFLLGNLRLNITFNHREDRTPSVAQGMLVDQDPEIDGPSCPGEYYWEQRHLTNLIRYVEKVETDRIPTPPPAMGLSHTDTHYLRCPKILGPRDDAMKVYSKWQENCLDLEQIYTTKTQHSLLKMA
ncbi:conserved hypothetical protein [Histoplasma capsulatum var. duboisii H88]|uniref:Uncharacterized protein n=1 Tax=Ajellomyces capsulatus (strain H88) TaxID=544711 RepID=F0UHL7_AJEC8|nr:conserved hypothetical protein [Histoplasma capsulatum var. duboisii H88]